MGVAERGDVLAVAPDDWTATDDRFGKKECWRNPPAQGGGVVCIEVSDVPREALGFLLAPIPGERYRRYRLRWEDIPPAIRTELEYSGYATLTWGQVGGLLLDKAAVVAK